MKRSSHQIKYEIRRCKCQQTEIEEGRVTFRGLRDYQRYNGLDDTIDELEEELLTVTLSEIPIDELVNI